MVVEMVLTIPTLPVARHSGDALQLMGVAVMRHVMLMLCTVKLVMQRR